MMPREEEPVERLTRIPIGFPEDLYEWMRETAHRRRVPMAELVREALREYRDKVDPQIEIWGGGGHGARG